MDFSWTDEQLAFKSEVTSFAQKKSNEGLMEGKKMGQFSRENWQRCSASESMSFLWQKHP
jgi:hypothetical protein